MANSWWARFEITLIDFREIQINVTRISDKKESTAKRHPLAKRGKLYSVCSDHELFLEFNITPDKT